MSRRKLISNVRPPYPFSGRAGQERSLRGYIFSVVARFTAENMVPSPPVLVTVIRDANTEPKRLRLRKKENELQLSINNQTFMIFTDFTGVPEFLNNYTWPRNCRCSIP